MRSARRSRKVSEASGSSAWSPSAILHYLSEAAAPVGLATSAAVMLWELSMNGELAVFMLKQAKCSDSCRSKREAGTVQTRVPCRLVPREMAVVHRSAATGFDVSLPAPDEQRPKRLLEAPKENS